jgi:hypothetical protein
MKGMSQPWQVLIFVSYISCLYTPQPLTTGQIHWKFIEASFTRHTENEGLRVDLHREMEHTLHIAEVSPSH